MTRTDNVAEQIIPRTAHALGRADRAAAWDAAARTGLGFRGRRHQRLQPDCADAENHDPYTDDARAVNDAESYDPYIDDARAVNGHVAVERRKDER
jgi:hypothetical protein